MSDIETAKPRDRAIGGVTFVCAQAALMTEGIGMCRSLRSLRWLFCGADHLDAPLVPQKIPSKIRPFSHSVVGISVAVSRRT